MAVAGRIDETLFDEAMQCYVLGVEYDFARKHGAIWIDEADCPRMDRVVAFFRAIDRSVERIDTFRGERQDTSLRVLNGGQRRRGTRWGMRGLRAPPGSRVA